MAAQAKKRETRSKSPGRARSSSRSRRSRSRSRSRGRKAGSKSPSQSRKSISPSKSKPEKESGTPTRSSARLAALASDKGGEKSVSKSSKPAEMLGMDEKPTAVKKTKSLDFGGPLGAFFMLLFLPSVLYLANLACWKGKCSIQSLPKIPTDWRSYFDLEAALIYFGWVMFQAVLYMLPIGRVVEGRPLVNGGKRLKYRCNGFYALLVSLAGFGLAVYLKVPVTKVYDKFLQIMTTGAIFSLVLSVILYIQARRVPKNKLASGGNSGNILYDFFIGHELNPRIRNFDIKFFCELRPGLIGWVMLNLVFISKQCHDNGSPSPALVLVSAFHFLYVADALWFESSILTTMDILHDGFGFMLAFGDLVWVPFLYTLSTRFLLENVQILPWYCLTGIAFLNFIGYYIFRGSNAQKNEFRRNPYSPALAHLETVPTPSGKRLLVSGWWGLCRHPNYLGDIIMSFAWSLSCGFGHILPYFYPLYFVCLLVHRERRDFAHCKKKYKASWDRYCEKVKYRIFPMVY